MRKSGKEEADLKMSIISKSNEVIVLADYSKANIISTYTFGPIDVAKTLIIDNKINKEFLKNLREHTIEIVISN